MKWLPLALLAGSLWAQSPSQRAQMAPDCVLSFRITGNTESQNFDNRFTACTNWALTYVGNGFTGFNVTLQSTTDQNGVPNALGWVAFAGTTTSGTNPLTAITYGQATFAGYVPWTRIAITGIVGAGSVQGILIGWVDRTVNLVTPAPGPGIIVNTGCPLQAPITMTGAGATQIVAASGTAIVKICELYWSGASAVDVKIVRGTGVDCGTGTTDVTGLLRSVSSVAIGSANGIKGTAGNAICLSQSGAINSGGIVLYALQ